MSALSDAAAALSAGEWSILSTNNFTNILDSGAGQITQYTDYAAWDAVNGRFGLVSGAHYEPIKFVIYDEATNTWAHGNIPDDELPAHGFNHMSCDGSGTFFHRERDTVTYLPYGDSDWSILADAIPAPGTMQVAGGMCWYPERNGLYFLDGDWGVFYWDASTELWSRESTGLADVYSYHNVCVYNPVHGVVLLGGGNNSKALYKVISDGTISRITDCPLGVGIEQTLFTCDPVSGRYLAFFETGEFYDYDVPTDTWDELDAGDVAIYTYGNNVINTVQVPIPAYGVIMFVKWSTSGQNVHLYKHTELLSQTVVGIHVSSGASITGPEVEYDQPVAGGHVSSTAQLFGSVVYKYGVLGATLSRTGQLFGPLVSRYVEQAGFGDETMAAPGVGSETMVAPVMGSETMIRPGFGAETWET